MATYTYQCKHCSITVKKDTTPTTANCSVKTSHSWTKLAETGDNTYSCKKCGTVIEAKATPTTANCPNATSHSWTKL